MSAYETAQLLANYAHVVSAIVLIMTLIIGMRQFRKTSRLTSQATSAEIFVRLEERFYRTPRMREIRRRAASELLSCIYPCSAFNELAGFFDLVGIFTRQGVLDEWMVLSSYYRNASAFWRGAQKCGFIERRRREEESAEGEILPLE